jgi:hypothetical protein
MAAAQTMQWTDKGYVSVNGGVQAGRTTSARADRFRSHDETATFTSTNKVKGGGLIDIGGAYRVWGKNLLVGVSFSHMSSKSDGSLTGSIPDPSSRSARAGQQDLPDLKHAENAVHLDAMWMMPVANKLDIGISAGRRSSRSRRTRFRRSPSPSPADRHDHRREEQQDHGRLQRGVDVQYMVAKAVGVGGDALLGRPVSLPGASRSSRWRLQIGGGVRFRF